MEQQIDEQFLILHGKAGNWPGDVSLACAEAIYRVGKTFPAGSIFFDINPGPGRSLIFLGGAARIIGAKIYTIGEFSNPADLQWYNRTIKLFRYQDIVEHRRGNGTKPTADFIVTRESEDVVSQYDYVNARGALLAIGNMQKLSGVAAKETGPGFALWRKP